MFKEKKDSSFKEELYEAHSKEEEEIGEDDSLFSSKEKLKKTRKANASHRSLMTQQIFVPQGQNGLSKEPLNHPLLSSLNRKDLDPLTSKDLLSRQMSGSEGQCLLLSTPKEVSREIFSYLGKSSIDCNAFEKKYNDFIVKILKDLSYKGFDLEEKKTMIDPSFKGATSLTKPSRTFSSDCLRKNVIQEPAFGSSLQNQHQSNANTSFPFDHEIFQSLEFSLNSLVASVKNAPLNQVVEKKISSLGAMPFVKEDQKNLQNPLTLSEKKELLEKTFLFSHTKKEISCRKVLMNSDQALEKKIPFFFGKGEKTNLLLPHPKEPLRQDPFDMVLKKGEINPFFPFMKKGEEEVSLEKEGPSSIEKGEKSLLEVKSKGFLEESKSKEVEKSSLGKSFDVGVQQKEEIQALRRIEKGPIVEKNGGEKIASLPLVEKSFSIKELKIRKNPLERSSLPCHIDRLFREISSSFPFLTVETTTMTSITFNFDRFSVKLQIQETNFFSSPASFLAPHPLPI